MPDKQRYLLMILYEACKHYETSLMQPIYHEFRNAITKSNDNLIPLFNLMHAVSRVYDKDKQQYKAIADFRRNADILDDYVHYLIHHVGQKNT